MYDRKFHKSQGLPAMLTRFWKRLARSTSGNALMFVGLGMPALIGAAGYGVDMAQLYMWKRELQHSVDQAAIAGAWALAYDEDSTNFEIRARQEFDGNQERTSGFDTVPVVQLGNYSGGTNNSVIVSATAAKRLPFSSFLIDKPLMVRATAQATFGQGATYQACLMALKKEATPTLTVEGSALVKAACGLGALSCEPGAIEIGGDDFDLTKQGVITDSIVTCGTADVPAYLESKVKEKAIGLTNPFSDLPPPVPTDNTSKTVNCPNGNAATTTTTNITPGRYSGGMNMKCKIVMAKGIYIVDGGVLDMSDQKANITGTGVMFVLRNGAKLKLGGQGNSGMLNLTPLEAAEFVGTANEPYKDLYAGMLVYEDKQGQANEVEHVINGNSNVTVRGTFYLPNGNMRVNGTAGNNPQCFQLWALTLKISGNANLTTTCDASETNTAGASAGGVRLVA